MHVQLLGVTHLGSFGAKARKHFNAYHGFGQFVRHDEAAHLSLITRKKHTPSMAQIEAIGGLIEFVGGPRGVAASIIAGRGPAYAAVLAAHEAAVKLGVRVRAERLRDAQTVVATMTADTLAAKKLELDRLYGAFKAKPIVPPLKLFESVRPAAVRCLLAVPRPFWVAAVADGPGVSTVDGTPQFRLRRR